MSSGAVVPPGDRTTIALAAGVALCLLRTGRDHSPVVPGTGEPGPTPPPRAYAQVVEDLRRLVAEHVPPGATVLVISRGDPALVELGPVVGRHFPADDLGVWAGHHPAIGTAAALLDAQRRGATHLALPVTGSWWLDTYPELTEVLATGELVAHDDAAGWIWRLPPTVAAPAAPARSGHDAALAAYRANVDAVVRLLDALGDDGDLAAVVSRGDDAFLATSVVRTRHFPGDADGRYAGHPADDDHARRLLAELADDGVRWLALPADATWWAEHHPGFWADLERRHDVALDRPGVGRIVRLTPTDPERR